MSARALVHCLAAFALMISGCARHIDRLPWLDVPPYYEPGGFSSTYHRSLYGPVPGGGAVPVTSRASAAPPLPVPRDEGPGYLLTDERRERLREALPGSRLAARLRPAESTPAQSPVPRNESPSTPRDAP